VRHLRLFLANLGHTTPLFPIVTPPLGILYLAAYLRTKFDLDIQLVNQRIDNCSSEELARRAIAFRADIVGLCALTPSAHFVGPVTKAVREGLPAALMVLGGPHPSAFRERALDGTEADAAIVGEGEWAFERLIEARFGGGHLSDVPGLIWRGADGRVIRNPGFVPIIADVDSLPFPAYDLIDLSAYWRQQSAPPIPGRRYISLLSSRGCPSQCSYCHTIFGKRFRAHSPERMVEEIAHVTRAYGIRDVEFQDDVFTHDPDRVFAFADLLRTKGISLRIALPNGVRGDTLTVEVIDALKASGLYYWSLALESGSPRIQQWIGKRLDIPKFLDAVEASVARRIFTNAFCMLGFPTETEDEMRQTIRVACDAAFHTGSFFSVTPYPNTLLYEQVKASHPDRLAGLDYVNRDLSRMHVNLSEVPDDRFYRLQRSANRLFFLRPGRLIRILRDHPNPFALARYAPILLNRIGLP